MKPRNQSAGLRPYTTCLRQRLLVTCRGKDGHVCLLLLPATWFLRSFFSWLEYFDGDCPTILSNHFVLENVKYLKEKKKTKEKTMKQGHHEASYGVFLQRFWNRNFQNKECPLEERAHKGNDTNLFSSILSLNACFSFLSILFNYGNIKVPMKQQRKHVPCKSEMS